ncbi:hypothetical protein JA9_002036 [Meyerozyma sp. JA9]|nr:hypothetical protein JA9_002036 [Meyerozyma sp. JA9]
MTTYEKIVKGATKVKVAAPKPKYIEPILMATSMDYRTGAENFSTIMRTLQVRLQDNAWSVVYKSLLVIHIMIREGDRDVVLEYLSQKAPHMLNLSSSNIFRNSSHNSDVKYIVKYAKYLQVRVKQFDFTGIDYVRDERSNNSTSQTGGRLRSLSVEKGLLRETESVQKQIDALLKNSFMENEINNDMLLTAFRLLVNDLLALFQELNEGVINLLEHYFEMSRVDAETALKIYKKFVDQTKYVIDYLRVAKHLEYATKLHVPTIKHAPTALTSSLEEYLDDPNFEANRRQFLAEKQLKSNAKNGNSPAPQKTVLENQKESEKQRVNSIVVQQSTFNPWSDQTNQTPQPWAQQNSAIVPASTGVGFGGYGPQVQQNTGNPFLQTQDQSQLQQQQLQQQQLLQMQQQQMQQQQMQQQQIQQQQLQQQHTQQLQQTQPFQQQPLQQLPQQQTQQFQQFQPMQQQNTQPSLSRSDTNPFAYANRQSMQPANTGNPFANTRFATGSTTTALSNGGVGIAPQRTYTGSNPFAVSETTSKLFEQASAPKAQQPIQRQPTAGGLENLPTIPVFPETQQQAVKTTYWNNAQASLHQNSTGYNQFSPSQPQNQFGYQGTGVQPVQQQPIQQQPTYSAYNGPSLI